jgi:DNA-binding response OmpR family regulator
VLGQSHVLVVEDNEHVTSALRILLEAADHRVSTAGSIAEALAVARRDPAALVLLDLTLPDGDGLALVPALRATGSGAIVALTGHDDSETRERCLKAGCVDVLLKPVPARELIKRAGEWLSGA